jgi:hypothetical protein
MSLNWRFSNEEVYNALPKTQEEAAVTNILIWGSMSLMLGSIEEDNIEEWVFRSLVMDEIDSPIGHSSKGGKFVSFIPTVEQLRARIGLCTNATEKTRAGFMKAIKERIERDCAYAAKRIVQEQKISAVKLPEGVVEL